MNIKQLFILLFFIKIIAANAQHDSTITSDTKIETESNADSVDVNYTQLVVTDTLMPIRPPKIILCYSYDYNYSTKSTRKKISYFYIDGDMSNRQKVGMNCKNLLPYLKKDPEAMIHYKKYKTTNIVSKVLLVPVLASFVGVGAAALNEEYEMVTYATMVLVPTLTTHWIFGAVSYKQLKIAVKTYNKNAGYGFVNGLEGK